jgi:integrase
MPSERLLPAASLVLREQGGRIFYEAKFRHEGEQVWRRVGPAWLEHDPQLSFGSAKRHYRPRRGRMPAGYFDERAAHVRAAEIVARYVEAAENVERIERERRSAGVTFREVAHAYLDWMETIRNAAPSTLQQHRYDLAEPDVPHRRGRGKTTGDVMRTIGDKPASRVTTEDVEALLEAVASRGVAGRTVNRHRDVVSAVFSFGMRSSKFRLKANPVRATDSRAIPHARPLVFYTPEEIEAIARALEAGAHRHVGSKSPAQLREADQLMADRRDADAVRVAAYAGLRLGELLALRVGDIDWAGSAVTISRAVSVGVEKGTKSGRIRQVPLADHAARALARALERDDFLASGDYVFCSAHGRRLEGSALRRRYKLARDAAGLRPLRWHDLRHTFGSLLVAGGIDLVSVKDAMGHAELSTTSRYLHARPAPERAVAFTAAFERIAPMSIPGTPAADRVPSPTP